MFATECDDLHHTSWVPFVQFGAPLYDPRMRPRQPFWPSLIREEMSYWLLQPDPSLRPYVKSYFVSDVTKRANDKLELHMPDGYAELVFVFGAGYERHALDTPSSVASMRHSYVIGGRSRSIVTRDSGRIRVIGVKLEPGSLRGLIRSPLTELRDRTVDLRDVNDHRLLALEDQLADCLEVQQIGARLDRFLLDRREAMRDPDPLAERLMKRIRLERGCTSLTRTAEEYGVDPRTMERHFIAWSGMSAKAYCRIVRFKLAYHAFLQRCTARSGSQNNDATRSVDPLHGFYDQSHFIREFRFFTGTSPRQVATQRIATSTDVTNLLLEGDLSTA